MKDNLRALINAWRSESNQTKPPPIDYTKRVFVLAHFVDDAAYKQAQKIAQATVTHGGTPIETPHLALAYFGDVDAPNELVSQVEKELGKLSPFSVAVQGLDFSPSSNLWLTLAKAPKLRAIVDSLADIVLWSGFSHRGAPMRDWVPHVLLATFPANTQLESSTLPWDTKKCKKLTVNEMVITRQLDENDFETLARVTLTIKKATKTTSPSAKKKTPRAKTKKAK
jgi:2'-5' RNA ligase